MFINIYCCKGSVSCHCHCVMLVKLSSNGKSDKMLANNQLSVLHLFKKQRTVAKKDRSLLFSISFIL